MEPVVEYPFDFEKNIDEEVSTLQSDPSPYADDGSLEVLFHEYFYLPSFWNLIHAVLTSVAHQTEPVNLAI